MSEKKDKTRMKWNLIKVKSLSVKALNENGEKHREKKKFNFFQWMANRMRDFCSVTALHGYGHIVRKDTHLWERIGWAFIVLAALIVSIVLLYFSWMWNAETPTVTVIESTHYATWNIPFPAVTICNSNRISAATALDKATSMTRPVGMAPANLSAMFRLALHFEGTGDAKREEYSLLHDILKANNIKVDTLVKELTPDCTDMIVRCMWKGTQARCDTLFQVVQTTIGYCCSFNYYGLEKSNFPVKLSHSIPKIPRRVTACGFETGLSIILRPKLNDYHSTTLSSFGFLLLIHDSYDFGDENAEIKMMASKLEGFIAISPEATYSTPDVYSLPVKERKCLGDTESKMQLFYRYSYVNCLAECRSRIIYEKCGCVPYNLPTNGTLPICEMIQIDCVKENRVWFQGSLPGNNNTVGPVDGKSTSPCNCLPDCELYEYPTEISTGELNRAFSFNSLGFFKNVSLSDGESVLHVFFKDLVSTHYRNDMYQNWLGVLASFGGLLGLFLGFSLVTGFELIYFFTLRNLFDLIVPKKVQHKY